MELGSGPKWYRQIAQYHFDTDNIMSLPFYTCQWPYNAKVLSDNEYKFPWIEDIIGPIYYTISGMYTAKSMSSYQIHKIAGCTYTWNDGNVFPDQLQRKPLVSDPGMHHGTCVMHVPWCISGSLTRGGENVPGIPGACATQNFTYLIRGPCDDIIIKRHLFTHCLW